MDLFLENCGVHLLEVSVERPGGGVTVHRFADRPFVLVGRDPRCDLRLDDERVSRRHAYLQAAGGRLYCADLGSRTGVQGPDGPRAPGWVEWEEPLRVGGTVVRVRPTLRDAADSPPVAGVAFEIHGGPAGAVSWAMRRPLALVGGAAACKVRLQDPLVSRFHAGLVQGPLGVWAVDLLSRSGTLVNGRPAPQARLGDGDELGVGPYSLRVRYESPGAVQAAPPRFAAPAGRALLPAPTAYGPPATLDHSLLLPVINEFNVMQQQMLDQFHQTMMMMAEMFTSLHKEQSALVREELDQLRRLTRELNALQAEQARQSAPGRAGSPQLLNGPAIVEEGRPPAEPIPEEPPVETAPPVKAPPTAPAAAEAPADVHDWLARRIDELQTERQGRWQKLMRLVTGR